jgi:methylenetetrahydrofolate--tRNA-(uracil-5-)-methyltransferase
MHRNLYINSRAQLQSDLSDPQNPFLFFAGQITGVEGYFESACMGLLTARFLAQKLQKKPVNLPPATTALGALLYHITDRSRSQSFQPTNINWGLFMDVPKFASKEQKRSFIVARALQHLNEWIAQDENLSVQAENFSASVLAAQL